MTTMMYLKPGCDISTASDDLVLNYRGRAYPLGVPAEERFVAALRLMDGRTEPTAIARRAELSDAAVTDLSERLLATPIALDGGEFIRGDRTTGAEAYYLVEGELWRRRFGGGPTDQRPATQLERAIAGGTASVDVVQGFCLEIMHQVSNAPTEIALAVAHAPDKTVRDLYMTFYEEESPHGDMLREALSSWIDDDHLGAAVPLPESVGLINTYNWWASTDPLLYAVALIRDEGSGLDAPMTELDDPYAGMRTHYDVPDPVVERFRWHAHLDVDLDHGGFPLEVFSAVELVDPQRLRRLYAAARTITDLYQLVARGVLEYYGTNPPSSRWS